MMFANNYLQLFYSIFDIYKGKFEKNIKIYIIYRKNKSQESFLTYINLKVNKKLKELLKKLLNRSIF